MRIGKSELSSFEAVMLAVVVVMCLLRVGLFWINPAYSLDEMAYLGITDGAYHGLPWGQVTDTFVDTTLRAPVLPFTLYLAYLVTGPSEAVAKLLVPILSVAAIVVTYLLGKIIHDRRLGLVAAAVVATAPVQLFFSYRVLPENLLGLLVAVDFLFFFLSLRDRRWLMPLGATAALTAITRFSGILILPALMVAAITIERRNVIKFIFNGWMVVATAVFLLVMTPWMAWNMSLAGNPAAPALEHLSLLSFSRLFGHYLIYWIPLVGLAFPLVIYGAVKARKDVKVLAIAAALLILLLGHDLFMQDIRYITFTIPLLALLAGWGVLGLMEKPRFSRAVLPILLAVMIINTAAGFYVIGSFAYPIENRNLINMIIEVGPGTERAFNEHQSYLDAGMELARLSSPDDKVISNTCLPVWWYTKRTCWYIAYGNQAFNVNRSITLNSTTEVNEFVADNDVRWIYIQHTYNKHPSKELLQIAELNTTMIYNNSYVAVYRIDGN